MIQLYALIRDTLVIQRHRQAEIEGMVEKDIPSKQQPKDPKLTDQTCDYRMKMELEEDHQKVQTSSSKTKY